MILKYLNKTIEYILNILIIIVAIILVLLIVYGFQIKILNKEYANLFGYTMFEVATGSMSGTIEVGDTLIVKITKDVKINDIIVFKQQDNFITHRIIKIDVDSITTKGDANNTEDTAISKEDVLGKAIKIIPNIYIWKKVLSTPIVFISIIITVILFGLAFSYNIPGEKKKKDKKKISTKGDKNV